VLRIDYALPRTQCASECASVCASARMHVCSSAARVCLVYNLGIPLVYPWYIPFARGSVLECA
jgi:hypothetical protein